MNTLFADKPEADERGNNIPVMCLFDVLSSVYTHYICFLQIQSNTFLFYFISSWHDESDFNRYVIVCYGTKLSREH